MNGDNKNQENEEFDYPDLPLIAPAALPPASKQEAPRITVEAKKALGAAAGAAAGPAIGRVEPIVQPSAPPQPSIGEQTGGSTVEPPPVFEYKERQTETAAPRIDPLTPPKEWAGSTSVGILGGKGVGKTMMFLALLERTTSGKRAGALTSFRPKIKIERPETTGRLLGKYRKWEIEPEEATQTNLEDTQYHRMTLTYPGGLLNRPQKINVDMVDTSGEALEGDHNGPIMRVWDAAYKNATILIFCFPMWAAFPSDQLTEKDKKRRDAFIVGFGKVLSNYNRVRNKELKVRVMLALTMADDNRSRLTTLRKKWIEPYFEGGRYSATLAGSNAGIVQYLANARRVSDYLRKEFDDSNSEVAEILLGLENIDNLVGAPWIIPITAFDSRLRNTPKDKRPENPIPAHVELPLLVAMCDRHNVLM